MGNSDVIKRTKGRRRTKKKITNDVRFKKKKKKKKIDPRQAKDFMSPFLFSPF